MLLRVQILQKYRLKSHNAEMGMIHMPFTVPDRSLLIEFTSRLAREDAGRLPATVLWSHTAVIGQDKQQDSSDLMWHSDWLPLL